MYSADSERIVDLLYTVNTWLDLFGLHLVMTEEKSSTFSTLKKLHFKFHTAYTEAAFCPRTLQSPMILTNEISEMRMPLTWFSRQNDPKKKVIARCLSYSDHVCYVHRLPCRSEMFQVISTMPRHHSSFCKATVQLPLEKVCPRRSATMANVGQPVWNCTSAWSSREATTRFLMVSLSKSSACQSNHLPSYHLCLVALRVRSSLAMLGLWFKPVRGWQW